MTQLAQPGAFPLQLSLTLLAGVVIGGLGSLVGAVWGAALLVFLPNWTNDIASSFSLSTNVSHNLPIAVYGLVLIGAMLAWPSGIQGGVRALAAAGRTMPGRPGRGRPVAAGGAGATTLSIHVSGGDQPRSPDAAGRPGAGEGPPPDAGGSSSASEG